MTVRTVTAIAAEAHAACSAQGFRDASLECLRALGVVNPPFDLAYSTAALTFAQLAVAEALVAPASGKGVAQVIGDAGGVQV